MKRDTTTLEPLRTPLFVPGTRPDRVDKAVETNADAVIIDLEDTVPRDLKPEARKTVVEKVRQHQGKTVLVRVNSLQTGTPWRRRRGDGRSGSGGHHRAKSGNR